MTVEWLNENCREARITRHGLSAEVYHDYEAGWWTWRFRKSGYQVGWFLTRRLNWRRYRSLKARQLAEMQADWEPAVPIPTARLLR